ncbi:hypothetical protein [Tropicimonas sp. IMCC34011]|uniref:hypothetical protein n=1 Tax=Tropicimonas sp. IMCC34011 TaxID=2248759 RepID=UPI0013004588|nr:hypothetical protein [Tropicimonas sp. IMCC34011]
MNRAAAIAAYQSAKARRDTRGQSAARKAAYVATHEILARGPAGPVRRVLRKLTRWWA